MINHRAMGREGYWYGTEVEGTPFYGMETLFLTRGMPLDSILALAKDKPHIFFDTTHVLFFSWIKKPDWEELALLALNLIQHYQKCVTIQVATKNIKAARFASLKCIDLPAQFCLLIAVEVPQNMLQNYAVKLVPQVAFTQRENETGVITLDTRTMTVRYTHWNEYEKDVDGV